MKLVVVGVGQGGSNIADEFAAMGEWVWKNRKIRLFTGAAKDPIYTGIFAINLGAGDLYGLQNIPQTDDHTILIGTTDEFRGRGAGKVNTDGAEQARRNAAKIASTIRDHGDVYSADAILVIATTAGGTGSGGVGVICDLLKDEFKKPTYAMLVLPFANQYDEPASMLNTATCLRKVLSNCKADAVFIIDNEKFVRKSETVHLNYTDINRRIADSFMDILCVGEETDRRYIGEVLDANDVIRILKGPCAIGVASTEVPPQKVSLFKGFKSNHQSPRHFSFSKIQTERAQNVVHAALAELSVDCDYNNEGKTLYDAQNVLGLFSGPDREIVEEIVAMMDNVFADKIPEAGRRKGTYPGRTSDTISVTVIVAGLGSGELMEKTQWFYQEGIKMMNATKKKEMDRKRQWEEINKAGEALPEL